ncbi:hypothetical protein Rhe02_05230 [Rhizocola hellebori]|uniref:Uncharacterized protein n=1 Tax=Rhizocola hellebori TaxID=1392758 RepID=A0A8J3VDH4_9ACTN|nr:GvpL/GvpF family gas vesicle protein [Rhizocola hellebori]GIH02456.1 hypothetical protein Rhe02_05230 [Rhizocola hellebori]
MWYLYALAGVDDAHAIGPPPGIDDRPVKTLVAGDLVAFASEIDAAGFEAALRRADLSKDGELGRAVRAHDRVIWHVFAHSAVLPCRFGTVFATQEALAGWLRTEYRRFREALDLVRDAAEWDIEVQAACDVDGNEVLDVKGRQQASLVYETVRDTLAGLALRARDGFYLVRRDEESAFAGKVFELVEAFPGTQIRMTGPQPAYHFMDSGMISVAGGKHGR